MALHEPRAKVVIVTASANPTSIGAYRTQALCIATWCRCLATQAAVRTDFKLPVSLITLFGDRRRGGSFWPRPPIMNFQSGTKARRPWLARTI